MINLANNNCDIKYQKKLSLSPSVPLDLRKLPPSLNEKSPIPRGRREGRYYVHLGIRRIGHMIWKSRVGRQSVQVISQSTLCCSVVGEIKGYVMIARAIQNILLYRVVMICSY